MTQYVCNPIVVDAFQIVEVIHHKIPQNFASNLEYSVRLDNDEYINLDPSKTSRMIPAVGDYLVRTHKPDEYEYLNPKHVFEAKYTKIPETATTPSTEAIAHPEGDEGAEGEAAGEAA